ncbi:hypothetical protein D9M71_420970 [compost metagenome]
MLAIAEDLHLDVPRLANEALQVHGARTEGGLGFALGQGELAGQLGGIMGDADTAPATTGGSLDQQRVAHRLGAGQGGG